MDRQKKIIRFTRKKSKTTIHLVRKYGIKEFSTPAGGCLLTDPQIGSRMLKILKENKPLNELTAQLSVIGRHIIEKNYWIMLGRNDKENRKIFKIVSKKLPLYTLTEPAPIAVILDGNPNEKVIKDFLVKFSKKAQTKINSGENVEIIFPSEEEFGE